MLGSGLLSTILIVVATGNGVVVTADSAPAKLLNSASNRPTGSVAAMGDRVVIAATGLVDWDAKAADGSVVSTYDFDSFAKELAQSLPRNARATAVAEAARAKLTKIVEHVGTTKAVGHLPNIVLVVAGLDGKKIEVWTVTAHIESTARPVVVDKQKNFPGSANPYFGAYGIKRTQDQLMADWRAKAPPRLLRDSTSTPLTPDEWAELAGLMVATEPHDKPPIRQWLIVPGEKINTREWKEPQP